MSRKRLDLKTPFQRTTNRKWHMGCQVVTWPMTSRDPRRCCEAVRSAIIATAWLPVSLPTTLCIVWNALLMHILFDLCHTCTFMSLVLVLVSIVWPRSRSWDSGLVSAAIHQRCFPCAITQSTWCHVMRRSSDTRQQFVPRSISSWAADRQ